MAPRMRVILTEAQLRHARHAVGYTIEFSWAGDWEADAQRLALRERTALALDAAQPMPDHSRIAATLDRLARELVDASCGCNGGSGYLGHDTGCWVHLGRDLFKSAAKASKDLRKAAASS